MRSRIGALIAVAVLAPFSLAQDGEKRMPPVVLKALAAARNLRYSGTRTVSFREGTERRSHVELILKDGPRSRIWFPTDSPNYGQVIIENGPKRVQYMPGSDKIIESPSRGDDALRRLAATIKNAARFRIEVAKGDRIAGFQTQRADMTDRKGNRLQSLWIEPRSGMVLKRELYDRVGAVEGSFEFSTINFNPKIAPRDFEINRNAKLVRLAQQLKDLCLEHGFEPMVLSKASAYALHSVRVINPKGRLLMLMQAYSGPRGVVTLFQVKGDVNPVRLEKLARGKTSAYSWKRAGKSLVLVGEIDRSELEKLSGLVGKL